MLAGGRRHAQLPAGGALQSGDLLREGEGKGHAFGGPLLFVPLGPLGGREGCRPLNFCARLSSIATELSSSLSRLPL